MSRRVRKVPRWLRLKRAREAERRALTRAERERARSSARALAWILLLGLAFAALGWTCYARKAHAAARVPIGWHAPAGAARYEAITRRPDGVWLALTLSGDSAGTAPFVMVPVDSLQRAWVLISTDWRAGAWIVRVRGCNDAGCSDWSNRAVLLAGIPDTLWHLRRGEGPYLQRSRDGAEFKRAGTRVIWSLQPADSVALVDIEHQEDVQRREAARLCELFGFWALRGRPVACP